MNRFHSVIYKIALAEARRAPPIRRPGMEKSTGDSCGSLCRLLPHCHLWEAPNCEKAKMFKVLREILEENKNGKKCETSVPGPNWSFMFIPNSLLMSILWPFVNPGHIYWSIWHLWGQFGWQSPGQGWQGNGIEAIRQHGYGNGWPTDWSNQVQKA